MIAKADATRVRPESMIARRIAARINGQGTVNRQFALLLFAVALAGCQSVGSSSYS